MLRNKRWGILLSGLLVALLAMPVLAQNDNGGGNGNGGGGNAQNNGNDNGNGNGNGGGGRRNFGGNMAQFRQRMMDNLKQELGVNDDEFAAIQPKLENVMQLQRDLQPPRFGMFGRGGPGGQNRFRGGFGAPTTQPTPVSTAMDDLSKTLDDPNASPDVIKEKLDAVREARTKERQELAAAQQDLKSLLTQRQEAVMVLRGYLD